MRYPASDDIIYIHTCVISLLTNQLKIVRVPSSTCGFPSFGLFGVFPLVLSNSRVEVKF